MTFAALRCLLVILLVLHYDSTKGKDSQGGQGDLGAVTGGAPRLAVALEVGPLIVKVVLEGGGTSFDPAVPGALVAGVLKPGAIVAVVEVPLLAKLPRRGDPAVEAIELPEFPASSRFAFLKTVIWEGSTEHGLGGKIHATT